MSDAVPVRITVNGESREAEVEPRLLLVHLLRDQLGLTGTHVGCDTTNCGACTVHLDGEAVKSCTVLAVQADGAEVTTIEGLGHRRRPAPAAGGVLGRSTASSAATARPGMIMAAADLLERNPEPDRGRDPPRARGQPLPLHRLPQHRRGACRSTPPRPAASAGEPA